MRAGGRSFGLCAALAILLAGSVRAATYLPISDAELAARSPVIVHAQVLEVSVALESLDGSDHPFTYVTLHVLEAIKGPVSGPTIRLRLPGGHVGNVAAWIPGTPEFTAGQEVVLLARPAQGLPGMYHLSEFALGRFDIVQDETGRRFAVRPAFDTEEDLFLSKCSNAIAERAPGQATPLRDADSFLAFLWAAGASSSMAAVAYGQPAGAVSAVQDLVAITEWANIGGVENGTNNLFRWFWDTGNSPNAVVQVSGTQTNLTDSSNGLTHVQNGINQWHSGVPSTDIRVSGISGSGNITVFLDAAQDFNGGSAWTTPLPCGSGGVIGLGGPNASGPTKTFKGDSPYWPGSGGNVSMRQVTGGPPNCYDWHTFRTAVMHELGHVLCLHHPDQYQSIHSTTTSAQWNAAVMHSVVPAAAPDTPQADDIQGMQFYYGTAACSAPTAAFNFAPGSPTTGQTVTFTDQSTGSPTSWSWNFGDGQSSISQNPGHSYSAANTYTVTLTASNASGTCSSSPVTHNIVVSPGPPTANFTFAPLSPVTNQTINFHDTSTNSPTSWSWDFGDGQLSSAQNPSHSYSSANTYTVKLTATNPAGSSAPVQKFVVVTNPVPPTAAFTFNPPSPAVGQNVFFTDTSTGAPTSWIWAFGDGTNSFAQSPTHAYPGSGTFTVMLTVQNGQGSNATSHSVVVSPGGSAPVAAFTFSPPAPQPNQTVTFTDTSTGGPTSWTWNFGDGFSSSLENPTHSYTFAGNYTVSLTAQNSSGPSFVSQSVVVAQGAAPVAAFTFSPPAPQPGQSVAFTDTSSGGPTSWSWDFGDGDGSAFQSPAHTFAAAGTYAVRLTVSNPSGSNQTSQSVVVKIPTPCASDPGILPANAGDNFCITLAAFDQRTGHAGPGLAIPQNAHFGYFSIPSITNDPDNPEVFVKVLDGRSVNGHFWVFYGGLTDLQYTLDVRDFQTGLTRHYTKPSGSASGGFDVLAFAAASTPDVERAPDGKPPAAPAPPTAPATQSGCANDNATLCLDSARGFTVTLAAVDQRTGHAGPGQAIPQSDVFGYFSIPALTSDPTNPEVFVKVLDGRAVNGHFWVFYGGLTDLQYTITVRDTATGQVRQYFKAGGSADGGFDVLAF